MYREERNKFNDIARKSVRKSWGLGIKSIFEEQVSFFLIKFLLSFFD
jgi:hypothetical protein